MIYYNGYCYYGTHGIKVSELIIVASKSNNINYCRMLRESFNDDRIFSEFISLEFYDGSAIDHSSVVHDLYNYYGSEIFWNKAKSLDRESKELVKIYLDFNRE